MNENLAKLVPILSNAFKVAPELVRPEARLAEDLHADSLDAGIALMDIEEAFGIMVPERERTYQTVGDILRHIEELLHAKQLAPVASSPTLTKLTPLPTSPLQEPSPCTPSRNGRGTTQVERSVLAN